jgi:hypothetical protein
MSQRQSRKRNKANTGDFDQQKLLQQLDSHAVQQPEGTNDQLEDTGKSDSQNNSQRVHMVGHGAVKGKAESQQSKASVGLAIDNGEAGVLPAGGDYENLADNQSAGGIKSENDGGKTNAGDVPSENHGIQSASHIQPQVDSADGSKTNSEIDGGKTNTVNDGGKTDTDTAEDKIDANNDEGKTDADTGGSDMNVGIDDGKTNADNDGGKTEADTDDGKIDPDNDESKRT